MDQTSTPILIAKWLNPSDLTLVSPAFGRPDLASELPLVPRVEKQS